MTAINNNTAATDVAARLWYSNNASGTFYMQLYYTQPGNWKGQSLSVYVNGTVSGLAAHQPKRALGYGTSKGSDIVGSKRYELANHLGNVLSVITDRKWAVDDGQFNTTTGIKTSSTFDGLADYYVATIVSYSDYDPFGTIQDGRKGSQNGADYRYGFNGKEADDEVKNEGNSYDFGARIYDPRLGRWLSLDPQAIIYPNYSPYAFVANMPIIAIDPTGEVIEIAYETTDADGNKVRKYYQYGSGLKLPKDKFVRQTVRTLRRLERRKDEFGIVKFYRVSTTEKIQIVCASDWNSSSASIEGGRLTQKDANTGEIIAVDVETGLPNVILWHPNSGWISDDGKRTQSAAAGLLHEFGHMYYNLMDPYCKIDELEQLVNKPGTNTDEIYKYDLQEDADCGDYDNYEDKWIIETVEPGMREDVRYSHREGFLLHTRGPFSRKGEEYGDGHGCSESVEELEGGKKQ